MVSDETLSIGTLEPNVHVPWSSSIIFTSFSPESRHPYHPWGTCRPKNWGRIRLLQQGLQLQRAIHGTTHGPPRAQQRQLLGSLNNDNKNDALVVASLQWKSGGRLQSWGMVQSWGCGFPNETRNFDGYIMLYLI